MNLEEAMKFNEESIESLKGHGFPEHAKAIELGNESMKRVLEVRRYPEAENWRKLPGED